jgi:hypothetical protein
MHRANARAPLVLLAAFPPAADEPHAASPSPAAATAATAVVDLIESMAEVYETAGNVTGTSDVQFL